MQVNGGFWIRQNLNLPLSPLIFTPHNFRIKNSSFKKFKKYKYKLLQYAEFWMPKYDAQNSDETSVEPNRHPANRILLHSHMTTMQEVC